MSLQADFFKKTFQFNFKARTSRGLMREKTSWFVRVRDTSTPSVVGIGECGPLPGLSIDGSAEYDRLFPEWIEKIRGFNSPDIRLVADVIPHAYPSAIFALETAILDCANGGKKVIYENGFIEGQKIPINGLIWMGDMDFMMTQINEKIGLGFKCIKIKVGGLDFDRECDVLHYIRKRYFREDITIRLDANGAFKLDDVLFKLTELSKFNIESIEQPIKPGLPEMEELCRKSLIPVAFDEELIGKHELKSKAELLDSTRPAYLVLKPTLHGGLRQCDDWISLAKKRNIGWWITSALESNIGLNAICQFTLRNPVQIPQGLGTGAIYSNNFGSPLTVENGNIFYNTQEQWNDEEFAAN
jgi:o-succinylbenzoate synthase